jgi:hypothetical protein
MRLPSCCSPYNDDETSLMAAVFGFLFYSCIDFLSQMDGEFKSLMMIVRISITVIMMRMSGKLNRQHADFSHRVPWRGNSCAFPLPTLALKARCLPFSGVALRPKGHTALEPPTDLFLKSVKIRSFLGFAPLFEEPCPLRLRMAFLISSPDIRFITDLAMLP